MKTHLLTTCAALLIAGCALAPKTVSPWQSIRTTENTTQVSYRTGERNLTLRPASSYERYRVLPRSAFLKHRVPVEASTAYAGRQGPYNYDIFYVMEEDQGQAIYGFTFGKFDIEWPPYLLYRIDRSGKVQAFRKLP